MNPQLEQCWFAPLNWTLNHFAFSNGMKTLCGILLMDKGIPQVRPAKDANKSDCRVCRQRSFRLGRKR